MKHDTILAVRYLFERVRGSAMDIKERVQWFTEQWMSRWAPNDEDRAREILGSKLCLDKATFEEMEDVSSELTRITAELGKRDFTLACKYALHRVPGLHLWGAMSWLERQLDS